MRGHDIQKEDPLDSVFVVRETVSGGHKGTHQVQVDLIPCDTQVVVLLGYCKTPRLWHHCLWISEKASDLHDCAHLLFLDMVLLQ